jgi:tetratricopeptide (TPR) repeat protein
MKDYQNAIRSYDRAIEINPNYADAYYNRGLAYKNLKDYQNAIRSYDRAIEIDPNYANAYCNRGSAYKSLS